MDVLSTQRLSSSKIYPRAQTSFSTTSRQTRFNPRVRGEHGKIPRKIAAYTGSSPRTRGTLHQVPRHVTAPRFIPAYAGNTLNFRVQRAPITVHPRVRGEHSGCPVFHLAHEGSSPRTRGTPRRTIHTHQFARFIPAYAGNTVFPEVLKD